MENTTNFGLKVYEGDDLFNPLTVENYNANAIDGAMKENEDAGVQTATELLSGTVHAITRSKPDAGAFRFTAVSRFTAGDTFTVDGVQVSALLTSGEQLPDGAYNIGAEVLATLKGTRLTVYISSASVSTAENSEKLGGELPAYYATATAVEEAQTTATSAGNLSAQNQQDINTINAKLDEFDLAGKTTFESFLSTSTGGAVQTVEKVTTESGLYVAQFSPRTDAYANGTVYINNLAIAGYNNQGAQNKRLLRIPFYAPAGVTLRITSYYSDDSINLIKKPQ